MRLHAGQTLRNHPSCAPIQAACTQILHSEGWIKLAWLTRSKAPERFIMCIQVQKWLQIYAHQLGLQNAVDNNSNVDCSSWTLYLYLLQQLQLATAVGIAARPGLPLAIWLAATDEGNADMAVDDILGTAEVAEPTLPGLCSFSMLEWLQQPLGRLQLYCLQAKKFYPAGESYRFSRSNPCKRMMIRRSPARHLLLHVWRATRSAREPRVDTRLRASLHLLTV